MSPMYHEPPDQPEPDGARAAPSAALRERVLGACRREMAARAMSQRRRRMAHWGLAAGVAVLLAVNHVEEQRIATLVEGPRVAASAPHSPTAAIAAWRARAVLLAALLVDPHAL
jgi:hypothetical protein